MTGPIRGRKCISPMFIIYDIIFILFAVLYFPYMIVRGKWHPGFKMRFSWFPISLAKQFEGKEFIWVHAVSVGEVLAAADFIRKVKATFPRHGVVCSSVTKTGHQIALEKLGDECVIIYAPLDFSWVVRRFIDVIKPKLYIAMETEIWPNLYTALHKNGVPILQINGRISDKAFKGYRRVRFLAKRVLACVDLFFMQSPLDAQRIRELGAVPGRVQVAGNLKFDSVPHALETRKEDLGFPEDEDLLIAGSTHPGEEDILIEVYGQLVKEFPGLRLIIAPRHVERARDVIRLAGEKGYKAVRFSQIRKGSGEAKGIVVVDTVGHLRSLYSLAKIVFVGKTLKVGGGQNMIEPAWFGKPTIVGPLTQNFKDVVNIFLESRALIQVRSAEELLVTVRDLLAHPQRAREIGEAAFRTVKEHQGATSRTVEAVAELLTR